VCYPCLLDQVKRTEQASWLTVRYFKQGNYIQAAVQYLIGLVSLAPWYPLEWIMPAWESQLTGLTDLWASLPMPREKELTHRVFGLHLNLARCAIELNHPQLAQICTYPVVRHPFATNRHMHKGWHRESDFVSVSSSSPTVSPRFP